MAVSEDERHDLFEGFIELMGQERTATLMELLPPAGWADVATKRDLDQQTALLRKEMQAGFAAQDTKLAELRTEMHAGFAAHDTRFAAQDIKLAELRTEMHAGFAAHDTRFAELRTEIAGAEARFERALREQTRMFLLGMVGANATLAGLALTFARLFAG